ncbi:MAG: ion channel [Blastomonas sp.]
MFAELAVATVMVVLTVFMHGAGLFGLTRLLKLEAREEAAAHLGPTSLRGLLFTLMLVLGLFILHGLEIWSYAFVYLVVEALPDLRTSVYFSTISYATIGYDDEGFAPAWQLVAAIEGVNGVILMGWSTAFFVTVVARLGRK